MSHFGNGRRAGKTGGSGFLRLSRGKKEAWHGDREKWYQGSGPFPFYLSHVLFTSVYAPQAVGWVITSLVLAQALTSRSQEGKSGRAPRSY